MRIEMARLSRDQHRRKKLADRDRRRASRRDSEMPGVLALPKDRIAAVVHRAVCEVAQGDGFGHCAHYAVAGSGLLTRITGRLYLPQAGDLSLFCDGDAGIKMDAALGGVRTGEFHSWVVGPVGPGRGKAGRRVIPGTMEVIDFSSRHYRGYVERTGLVAGTDLAPVWRLPAPPDYIWTPFRDLPMWMRVSADEAATTLLLDHLAEFTPLLDLTFRLWRESEAMS